MTLSVAIYGIKEPAEAMIGTVESMGRYFGLKTEPLHLRVIDDLYENSTEISIDSAIRERRLPVDHYAVEISDIRDDEYVLRNTGASVNFERSKFPGSLVAHTNNLEFSRFLSDPIHRKILAPAKGYYGFVLDWKHDASFWAYAGGFVEFKPTRDLTENTPSGLWGVEHFARPEASVDGKFRDIYEVNLISDKHLQSGIHGGILRELLTNESDQYGRLDKLADDWYEWIVPRERIAAVRGKFLSAGLLDPRFVDASI